MSPYAARNDNAVITIYVIIHGKLSDQYDYFGSSLIFYATYLPNEISAISSSGSLINGIRILTFVPRGKLGSYCKP